MAKIHFDWEAELEKELGSLPGEKSHIEMIPFRLAGSSYKSNYMNAKLSAVMCLFYIKNDELFGVLMERTEDGGKHSGQVSFPGGKKDTIDFNLKETALRETFEEIGIYRDSIKILGELTEVYIPVSNFLVKPYLGIIDSEVEMKLSKNEVKAIFNFSINELLNSKNKKLRTIKNHKEVKMKNIPCFILNDRIVWGATALILNEIKYILQKVFK